MILHKHLSNGTRIGCWSASSVAPFNDPGMSLHDKHNEWSSILTCSAGLAVANANESAHSRPSRSSCTLFWCQQDCEALWCSFKPRSSCLHLNQQTFFFKIPICNVTRSFCWRKLTVQDLDCISYFYTKHVKESAYILNHGQRLSYRFPLRYASNGVQKHGKIPQGPLQSICLPVTPDHDRINLPCPLSSLHLEISAGRRKKPDNAAKHRWAMSGPSLRRRFFAQ